MVQVPSQKVKIEDIQPYVILRGLLLTPEEKKKVILESNQSLEGKLATRKVIDSVRMLGARFFNEMSGLKKPQRTKVYDPNTLITQDEDVQPEASLQAEECSEGEFLEALVGEGDDDATLAADFEQAAAEVLQDNPELASAYSAYQDARKRLSEKFRNRGFWPTTRSSSSQKGKGYGMGAKLNLGAKASEAEVSNALADLSRRESFAGSMGHWKAECPFKGSSSTANASTAASSMPTTTLTLAGREVKSEDLMPLEFVKPPIEPGSALDGDSGDVQNHMMFVVDLIQGDNHNQDYRFHNSIMRDGMGHQGWGTARERLRQWGFRNEPGVDNPMTAKDRLRSHLKHQPPSQRVRPIVPENPNTTIRQVHQPRSFTDMTDMHACFASHGSHGVLDLGASKTVIGSEGIVELIQSLDERTRSQLSRCPCRVTFGFGNQATLTSDQALVIPIGSMKLKV